MSVSVRLTAVFVKKDVFTAVHKSRGSCVKCDRLEPTWIGSKLITSSTTQESVMELLLVKLHCGYCRCHFFLSGKGNVSRKKDKISCSAASILCIIFFCLFYLYYSEFIAPSMMASCPGPEAAKQVKNRPPAAPCFTSLCRTEFGCQTRYCSGLNILLWTHLATEHSINSPLAYPLGFDQTVNGQPCGVTSSLQSAMNTIVYQYSPDGWGAFT